MNREFNAHTFSVLSESHNKSHNNSITMNDETNHRRFYKSSNPNLTPFPHRRLRVADILLADEDRSGADSMHDAGDAPPPRHGYPSAKRFSPSRFVARLMAALRITKDHRALRRRQRMRNEVRDSEITSLPMNGTNGGEESGRLYRDDTSFKLGVGCGLLYLIAASKNELGKMVELRKEMEMLLQNVKVVLQSKDTLLKPLNLQSDAVACSITDVQEVSSPHSHLSVHSKTPYVEAESKGSTVHKRFLEYHVSEQDEFAEEINELQAEFEVELERLQLYLDREDAFEDAEQGKDKVNAKDSSSKSHSSSFSEIIMEPQGASAEVFFGVPPVELERRLHELLQARLQERITELESALEYTTQKLTEKDTEVTWWKDTARLISQHVPETSRFTFRLDSDATLKLSQIV